MLGWCAAEQHKVCPETIKPFYIERGKVVYRDEERICDCRCHGGEKKSTRTKKGSKTAGAA